jgi:hypothetical protein
MTSYFVCGTSFWRMVLARIETGGTLDSEDEESFAN